MAEVLLPEPAALAATNTVELDFSLGCQGRLDAGRQALARTSAQTLSSQFLSVPGSLS